MCHTWAPRPMTRGRGRSRCVAPPSPGPVLWTGLNRFEQWVETWEKPRKKHPKTMRFCIKKIPKKLNILPCKLLLYRPGPWKRTLILVQQWEYLKNTVAWAAVIHSNIMTQASRLRKKLYRPKTVSHIYTNRKNKPQYPIPFSIFSRYHSNRRRRAASSSFGEPDPQPAQRASHSFCQSFAKISKHTLSPLSCPIKMSLWFKYSTSSV